MKTVGNHKDSVAGLLTGTNLDNVTNLNGTLERAARNLVQKADVPEASGRQTMSFYADVYDYAINANIFGGALVDVRPQGVSRGTFDVVQKKPLAVFDQNKGTFPNGYTVAFEYKNGTPLMRVSQVRAQGSQVLDSMDDDTGWTASGSASALREDETVYYESPASLRFTLTGSSTGILTKNLTQALDLEEYEDLGVAFLAVRIPTSVTSLTSIALRIGSSASAYDEVTETDGFLGAWVADDFLLVAFDMSASTSTGTPDWSAIDYVQLRIAHTAGFVNFRVGKLFIALPSPHEVLYQTAALFMASGANPSREITDDSDLIILSDPAYTLYEYESALEVLVSKGGSIATGLAKTYWDKLNNPIDGLYMLYRADNPSQELREVGNWYE